MKHHYPLLLTIALIALCRAPLPAKHIIGGVLNYECLGDGLYRFTMKMYRDCAGGGANFDNNAPFSIYKGNSQNPITTIYRSVQNVTFIESEDNPCLAVPPGVCVQEGVYVFEYQFADWPSDESYTISYQRCCRNEGVANILTPGDIGATFTIELTPLAQALSSNSPVYNTFPPIVICANEPLIYDHSATDPDGDQIVYELCAPLKGGGLGGLGGGNPNGCNGLTPNPACPPPYAEVEFVNPPYSSLNPMGGNPAFSIDPVSGLLTGTPNQQGQFTVGVCIREYRNGQLLSETRRDFQFNVTVCSALLTAAVSGANVSPIPNGYLLTSCGDTQIHLDNASGEPDLIEQTIWEFYLPDTVFSSTEWDLDMVFPGPDEYQGRLLLNSGELSGCKDSVELKVRIFPMIHPQFNYDYDTCVAGPVGFLNSSYIEAGGAIQSFRWDFGDGSADTVYYHPTHIFDEAGNIPVSLTLADGNGCERTITEVVTYQPLPAVVLVRPNDTVGCVPSKVLFVNQSHPLDATYQVQWDFGDGETAEGISPVHTYSQEGLFDVRLEITSPIGCYTDTIFQSLVEIQPAPIADFAMEPSNFDNFHPAIFLFDKSIHAVHWDWYINGQLVAQVPDFAHSFSDTGWQEIMLVITHPEECLDTLVKMVDVVPKTTFYVPGAFTPNEDTVNDYFRGTGHLYGATGFRFVVYDRWSNVLFETDNPEDSWNGRLRNTGRQVPAGVYPWLVNWTDPRGASRNQRGFVTLLR